MDKTQITYYFGAGASCQAIPAVDGLRDRLKLLTYFLKFYQKNEVDIEEYNSFPDNLKLFQNEILSIIADLDWIYQESEFHQTIDTLAKKLYVQNNTEHLHKLKRGLISYFYFEQHLNFFPNSKNNHSILLDKRYDNLIACIANRNNESIELKGHIKFITWNYDLQIDYAISRFVNNSRQNLNSIKSEYNIHPNKSSLELPQDNLLIDINKFACFKLNGNAFLDIDILKNEDNSFTPYDRQNKNEVISPSELVGNYLAYYSDTFLKYGNDNKIFINFNFAWEEPKYMGFQNIIDNSKEILSKTKVLIIIGYSFPYFNSETDKEILSDCWPDEIIIQDLQPKNIKKRLLQLKPKFNMPSTGETPKIIFNLQKPSNYFPIHSDT